MESQDRARATQELHTLLIDYWHDVDTNWGRNAADGHPVLPTHPPIQLSLMTDHCVRDGDGRWLYTHRKFEPWFAGGTPATNPKLTERPGASS